MAIKNPHAAGVFRRINDAGLLRRRFEDLLILNKQKLLRLANAKSTEDVEVVAALSKGFNLVRIKTDREAIREGDALLTCLRDLRYPVTMHSHPMGSTIRALMEGDLWSMRDAEDRSVATLRFDGSMLAELRGFKNGGLLQEHALILREHFVRSNSSLDVISAERMGLVYQSSVGTVPYEKVLGDVLSSDFIQIDGWPVSNADMEPLRGRRGMHRISVINCASLSALPEDIEFRQDRRSGVIVRRDQQEPWSLEEANGYLQYLFESRPRFERTHQTGLNL